MNLQWAHVDQDHDNLVPSIFGKAKIFPSTMRIMIRESGGLICERFFVDRLRSDERESTVSVAPDIFFAHQNVLLGIK